MSTRPITLEVYADPPNRSLDPAFQRVIVGSRAKHPEKFNELRDIAVRLAAQRGSVGFTSEDLMEEAGGRDRFPRNMPGIVLGNLRAMHAICTIGRVKSSHPKAKGRWVNVFALNGGALRVDG